MNRRIVIIIILAALLLFSGCANMQLAMMEALEEDDVKADVENILTAIENHNSDFIYDTYFSSIDEVSEADLSKGMQEIYNAYHGKRLSSHLYSVNVNSFSNSNGTGTVKTVVYLVKTDKAPYLLTINYLKDSNGEYYLYEVNLSEFLDYVVNDSFEEYDLKAWIVFFINIVSYVIMIIALIMCIKTKIKVKPLWIILILLQVGISITNFPNQFYTHFSVIQFLGISRYQLYAHGGTFTSLFFHVPAVVFLFVRKSLNKAYLKQEEKKYKQQENADNHKLIDEQQNTEVKEKDENINE